MCHSQKSKNMADNITLVQHVCVLFFSVQKMKQIGIISSFCRIFLFNYVSQKKAKIADQNTSLESFFCKVDLQNGRNSNQMYKIVFHVHFKTLWDIYHVVKILAQIRFNCRMKEIVIKRYIKYISIVDSTITIFH